jgi:hypothetical protein
MSEQTSLEYQIAYLHMLRALRPFRRAARFFVAVVLPDNVDEDEWKEAARAVLAGLLPDVIEIGGDDDDEEDHRRYRRACRMHSIVDVFEATSRNKKLIHDPVASLAMGEARTIGLIRRSEATGILAHPSLALADAIVDIPAIDPVVVQRAVQSVVNQTISLTEANDLTAMPVKLRKALRRTGRPLSLVLAKLRNAKAHTTLTTVSAPVPAKAEDGPRLEDLHGYGQAKTWGFELMRDLADFAAGRLTWDDVDTGLLLSGPPGTGKTTFARALANTCGLRLITGSYSSWQSTGHQGDMLRAMRRCFDAAREAAPCILLIDEIDSFVDRNKSGDQQEYMRGVVNGLLEQLDGAVDRTGVVVIGACNDPDNVDPALRRPGRLDRHVEIGLPDAQARAAILRYHLQADVDVSAVMAQTEGFSGADLERLARDARRLARRAGVPVNLEHLRQSMPPMRVIPPDEVRASAIHELGHAVVGVVLGYRRLTRVVVYHQMPVGAEVAGFAAFDRETIMRRDSRFLRAEICVYLASIAAETLFLGHHCDGVALDLQQATETATWMLGVAGMGDTLSSGGPFPTNKSATGGLAGLSSLAVGRGIEEILQEELVRAREIVSQYRHIIEHLADLLAHHGELDGAIVEAAVRAHAPAKQLSLALTQEEALGLEKQTKGDDRWILTI